VLAPLFGREDELVTLPALARAHRVVTVIGAGGIGKTHLVRHLLQQRSLDEEVRFVDLSGLQAGDAAQVPRTVAAALGVQLGPGDPARGIADALAEREMLLALDNAEHLVDAVAHLAEILVQTSPGLRIIVTSQIPLGIAPERVFRLAGLALPDGPVNVVSATGYSAIAFFVDRAQAADRHFTLTDDNVDLVVEICRQLDGLPLAMELAAARLQSVGLRGLSVALEHRFRLLTGGRRLAPARQQTLEAALDWSHELLDTREQAVFRRLGVFVGSFALSTAQRVAADEQLDEWAVVDALTVLVDRSLVVTTEHDPPRYRLLDSPRRLRAREASRG
jgi:predicted ATPase